jgi:hypothetical protein
MCCGSGPSKTNASYGSFVNNRPVLVGRLPQPQSYQSQFTIKTTPMSAISGHQFTNTGFLKVIKK